MDTLRHMHNLPGMDVIAILGFNNTTFRQFAELLVLQDLVHQHVTSFAPVADSDPLLEWELRDEYFRERLAVLISEAEIVKNVEFFSAQ